MSISTLLIWKKDATAYERLSELALLAQEKPEMFERFAIVYQEKCANGNWKMRYMDFGTSTVFETLGLFEAGKIRAYQATEK